MRTALLAAFITLAQLVLFLGAAPGHGLGERYRSGFQWDSVWYADIARRGYVSTIPPVPDGALSNVTHFPAYPLAIRGVIALGIDERVASLVVAQVCAWIFWMYVLAALARWSLRPLSTALVVGAIAAHPTAFFLVTAYSEPMFLAAAFGVWFWSLRRDAAAGVLCTVHGFVLTAARITGLGGAAAPVLAAVIARASGRVSRAALLRAAVIGACSACGALLFFAFCAWKFGAWDFYQIRQTLGWGHRFDALAAFYPSAYRFFQPDWHNEAQLGAFENPYVLAAFLVYVALWIRHSGTAGSGSLVLMGAIIFYLSVCAVYHTGFPAMARYQFPIHAMIVVGFADVLRSLRGAPPWLRGMSAAFLVALMIASLRLEWDLAAMFARGLRIL